MNYRELEKELSVLKNNYNIGEIYFFGSQKGKKIITEKSDIDLLIIFKHSRPIRFQRKIRMELQQKFKGFSFDIISLTEAEYKNKKILFQGKHKEVTKKEFEDAIKI